MPHAHLVRLVEAIGRARALCVGDAMIDHYIRGKVAELGAIEAHVLAERGRTTTGKTTKTRRKHSSKAVRPELLVKGADYRADEVVGGAFVQSYGGKVLLAQLLSGYSISATIARASA